MCLLFALRMVQCFDFWSNSVLSQIFMHANISIITLYRFNTFIWEHFSIAAKKASLLLLLLLICDLKRFNRCQTFNQKGFVSKLSLLAHKFKFFISFWSCCCCRCKLLILYFLSQKIMKIAGRKFGLVRKAPFFYQICLKRNTSAFEGIELKLVFRKQNLQIFCPFSTSSSRTAAQNMKHQSGLFFQFHSLAGFSTCSSLKTLSLFHSL